MADHDVVNGLQKQPKIPYQIRALEMIRDVLARVGQSFTTEGKHVLRCVEGPAKRAAARLEKKQVRSLNPLTPERDNFTRERKKTDAVFSLYIRLRDTTGPWEDRQARVGYCCTCGQLKAWKDLQCGHWKRRALWGTRWHPWNCHAQCRYCNDKHRGGGKEPEHEAYIIQRHGQAARDKLVDLVISEAFKPDEDQLIKIQGLALAYIEKVRTRNDA